MRLSQFRYALVAVLTLGALLFALPALAQTHVVKPGDTLWDLVGSRYHEVARANHIANPDLIYVGQRIELDSVNASVPSEAAVTRRPASPRHPRHATRSHRASAAAVATASVWDRIAQCESGGDWHISTGNGYYGGLQFTLSSWRAAGGSGNPAAASREEQIRVARNLQRMQGWGAWPVCSRRAGLR